MGWNERYIPALIRYLRKAGVICRIHPIATLRLQRSWANGFHLQTTSAFLKI